MIIKTKGITLTLVLALIINMLCLPGISVFADTSYSADYEPVNPNAIFENFNDGSAKAAIRLSWVNPVADTLQNVKIYGDDVQGENKFDTLIAEISNPVPGEVMDYVVKGQNGNDLVQGSIYTYRIVYDFADRKTEVLVSRIATARYNEFVLRNASNGNSKVFVNGSMANMPGYSQKIINDAGGDYLKMSANVAVHDDLIRELKFHIGSGKLSAGTYSVKITYKSDADFDWGIMKFEQTPDWAEVEKEVTTGNGDIVFNAYNIKESFQNLCIKSIKIYNISDGSLADSFDCSIYNIKPQAVNGVTAVASGTDVKFSIATSPSWWWNNGKDANAHVVNYYNIYEIIDGRKVFKATLARPEIAVTSVEGTLHNVSVGTHTYEVTCSDTIGLESEPVETVVEIADLHEISNHSATPYRISSYAVGMNVSWTNPMADTLSKVMLYREDADGDTLISECTAPTPGETMTYKDANLETNKTYSYKVVCSFTDYPDVEGIMNGYLDLDVKEFVASYHPKNMAAVQYGSGSGKVGITLSWINPCVMEISGITVSRMEENGEVFLTDSLDLTPEKVVEYSDLELTAGEFYTYKIKFDYPDHLSNVYYISAIAKDTEFRNLIRGVNIAGIYSKTKIVPGITSKLTKDNSGNRYMKLTVNVPEGDTERGAYFGMNSKTVLNAGQKYTFKMRIKTDETANVTLKCGDMGNTIGTERVAADGNWHEISSTFFAPYRTSTVMAVFDGSVLGMQIDDIEFSDDSGILDYFNFDEYDLIPAPPGTLEVSVSKNSATPTMSTSKDWWWSQEAGFDQLARTINYYNVYEKTDNGNVLRARLARPVITKTAMSAVIDNLAFGSEYTFFATTEDSYGVLESEPIETKFKTDSEPENIQVSDFAVRSSDGIATDSVKAGECTVSVDIGNYTDAAFKAQLMVAVYKANKLVKLCGTEITDVALSKGNKPTTQLKLNAIDISCLTGDDCTMDVMLWSGVDTMKILKGAKTFKIINN